MPRAASRTRASVSAARPSAMQARTAVPTISCASRNGRPPAATSVLATSDAVA
ncbi:Uncharacterised protein [Bordetella pertussis]|nr:Uncharacterised protein [Bordetella pertussis]CFP36551.1 Uncharacterised protein [Bordetella pertussis]CPI87419.1 Uncharacterised protein [Bordetella pertussis]CPJ86128.1 Uncharacterised protein [Bordetella pertussis]CPL01344.1 Uncharacterised protein [Bordetella pertussis]